MGVRRGGRPAKASDEAMDWCLEMKAVNQWSEPKIARELLKQFGVDSDVRPGEPVSVSAVRGYIAKASKRLNKENYYRPVVQRTVHARMLDDLTEQTYALRAKWGECDNPREWALHVDTVLKILKHSANLLDLDMHVERTEVRHTGKGPKLTMDTRVNFDLEKFEKNVQAERKKKQVPS